MTIPTMASSPRGNTKSLAWFALQVLIAHVLSAVLAESVFTREGFDFPGVYGTVEFATFAAAPIISWCLFLGAGAAAKRMQKMFGRAECARFIVCGVSMAASHGAGLGANCRINYTTAMVFSAAKLPTVMFVGLLIQRNDARTPTSSYCASLIVALGLYAFGCAESREAPQFNRLGLVLVAANLGLGAITFNLQQRALRTRSCVQDSTEKLAPAAERLMIVQYTTGTVILGIYAIVSEEFVVFSAWCHARNSSVIAELSPVVLAALLTAAGVRALLRVVQEFDAARASAITSSRKACTFVLSFFLFPKAFGALHFLGVALTLGGSLALHHTLSNASRSKERAAPAPAG